MIGAWQSPDGTSLGTSPSSARPASGGGAFAAACAPTRTRRSLAGCSTGWPPAAATGAPWCPTRCRRARVHRCAGAVARRRTARRPSPSGGAARRRASSPPSSLRRRCHCGRVAGAAAGHLRRDDGGRHGGARRQPVARAGAPPRHRAERRRGRRGRARRSAYRALARLAVRDGHLALCAEWLLRRRAGLRYAMNRLGALSPNG